MSGIANRALPVAGALVVLGVLALGAMQFQAQLDRMRGDHDQYARLHGMVEDTPPPRVSDEQPEAVPPALSWVRDEQLEAIPAALRRSRQVAMWRIRNRFVDDALRFSLLFAAPFALVQALWLILTGRGTSRLRDLRSTALVGLAISLLVALPLSLAWLAGVWRAPAIMLALLAGLFLPLRWFLLATPLVATRKTHAMDAFAVSARALSPHGSGIRGVLIPAFLLLWSGARLAAERAEGRLTGGHAAPGAFDVALLAAPGVLTLVVLMVAGEYYLGRVRQDLSTVVDKDMRRVFE